MSAFADFFADMLSAICSFLGSAPILWIVGLVLLLGILAFVKRLCNF